jgi:ribosomal protein L22
MTPPAPKDPQKGKKGKGDDAQGAQPAEEPKAKPKPKRAPAKKPAEATAAAEPKRTRSRAKKKDAEAPAGPTAAEVEAKASAKAAESEPAAKKTPKARADKHEPATPAPSAGPDEASPPAPARRRRGREQPDEPREPVTVRAHAKYVRTSARKARLVCDHIRGKDVQEARAILAFTPRAAAKVWIKLLESAVANAEHNHELVGEDLRVESVFADEGPTLKRYRPRAMGRATRIRKRTSHLTIALAPKQPSAAGREGR